MSLASGYPAFWPMVRWQSQPWYREDWPEKEAALAECFAYYDEVMCPGFVRMYWGMASDQVARTLFDLVTRVEQPTWLGWGDQDLGPYMKEGVQTIHRALPRSELRVFKGVRHSIAAEAPTRSRSPSPSFWSDLRARSQGADKLGPTKQEALITCIPRRPVIYFWTWRDQDEARPPEPRSWSEA